MVKLYLVKDIDGYEYAFNVKPHKGTHFTSDYLNERDIKLVNEYEKCNEMYWLADVIEIDACERPVYRDELELPKGTIEKLVGECKVDTLYILE